MTAPASPARWLRAAALAGSSVGLALLAHLLGGGHADPALLMLLVAAGTAGAHHWTARERGLLAIVAAVLLTQVVVHATLGLGHGHTAGMAMTAAHGAAAVLLAVFLRLGEARLHAAARRRYLQWSVTVRLALAGRPRPLPLPARLVWRTRALRSVWTPRVPAGRGPPAPACC
jgi:hypothetical protein